MGTFCHKERLQDSFQQKTSPFSQSSILLTVNKSCLRRRGLETPSKEGSEENDSGRSGFLFKDILYSQKEWEIKFNHMSVQTEFIPEYSIIQFGNCEQGKECHPSE